MNTIVKFNSIQEFNEELQIDRDNSQVSESIVRVTNQYFPLKSMPLIRSVHIVATYKTKNNLIKLDRFVGEIFDRRDTKLDDKLTEMTKKLELFIKSIGLEVRHGIFYLGNEEGL